MMLTLFFDVLIQYFNKGYMRTFFNNCLKDYADDLIINIDIFY